MEARRGMLDLHCHILPNVDDGPRTLNEALALARFSVADGITHITATPHCHRHLRLLRADILPHVAELNKALANAGLRLMVLPGSEIQLTDVAAYQEDYTRGLYCHLGDDPRYTLLEFPWHDRWYPAGAAEHVTWLREQGTTPIVAHPERHGFFRDDPNRLRALVDAGAWVQITVDSLLGNFGPEARVAGEEMLRTYPQAVLATDAHNQQRCSGLTVGYEIVRKQIGAARAEDLRARADGVLHHLLASAAKTEKIRAIIFQLSASGGRGTSRFAAMRRPVASVAVTLKITDCPTLSPLGMLIALPCLVSPALR
jgi:protein-tyrosine phosphatase